MLSPNTKEFMINLVDPDINKAGYIETIYDPAVGNGGLLIDALKYVIKKAYEKNINFDWNYVMSDGLCGFESNHDTYLECIMNMNIIFSAFNSNKNFNIINNNYLTNKNKYDIIMTQMPIEFSNQDSINYMYSCINSLNAGGRCCIAVSLQQVQQLTNILYDSGACEIRQVIFISPDYNDAILLYFYKKPTVIQNIKYYYYNNKCEKILLANNQNLQVNSQLYLEILRNIFTSEIYRWLKYNYSNVCSNGDVIINNILDNIISGGNVLIEDQNMRFIDYIFESYLEYLDDYESDPWHCDTKICQSMNNLSFT